MKKRRLFWLIFCILLLICWGMLSSCTEACSEPTPEISSEGNRLILLEKYKPQENASPAAYIFVDTETGVCYMLVIETQGAGLTVMVDAEGKPLVIPEYINKGN